MAKKPREEGASNEWMNTYSDLVTLLMCFFVLLFSMSSVDAEKWEMLVEAMADAAVADGMPRAQAYRFAAQSVYGAARMVLETGEHPGVLKDAVCSPGGTTIAAVAALERGGFRDTVITAQRACSAKSYEMSMA